MDRNMEELLAKVGVDAEGIGKWLLLPPGCQSSQRAGNALLYAILT
jgi:hypothetical protein